MAATHVALLRGINVGRAKRIAMADLRALLEGLGYREVRTLLNSGNVVFGAPGRGRVDHGRRIQQAIAAELGVESNVIVLDDREVTAVVRENSLLGIAHDPSRLLVSVPSDRGAVRELRPLLEESWGREALALGSRAAYLWCPDGILESRVAAAVGRRLRDRVTARNWATMSKLHALMKGDEA